MGAASIDPPPGEPPRRPDSPANSAPDPTPSANTHADSTAPKILPIEPRKALPKKGTRKTRLRSNLIYGEDRLEPAGEADSAASLEPLAPTPSSGSWSRESPQAATKPMDEEYHAKVRINQIGIERRNDLMWIWIWLGAYGFLLPGVTLFEGVDWLGEWRWVGIPIMLATVCTGIWLQRPERHLRQLAYAWNYFLLSGYLLMMIGLCCGQIFENIDTAERVYFGFIYLTLFISLGLTPLKRIVRSDRELATLENVLAGPRPMVQATAADELEAAAGWDEVDQGNRKPPA